MIFVDAGVFYARLAEDDQNHEVANLFFHGLGLTVPLITTNAVIYEAHALLLRLSRFPSIAGSTSPARGFLEEVDAGLCEVEHVNPDDHQVARRLIDRNRDKSYSYFRRNGAARDRGRGLVRPTLQAVRQVHGFSVTARTRTAPPPDDEIPSL